MTTKRITLLSILVTFSLLLWGGFVHNTESSLACPDWPLCYGQFFPNMEGGILIEHGHRLLASLVGLLTIFVVFFARKDKNKSEERLHIYRMSQLALFAVIAQGGLGGITVIYKLPTIVSTSHLGLSMIFFCLLIYIHQLASWEDRREEQSLNQDHFNFKDNWSGVLKNGALISTILIYAQMVLGAFMRHSGAGASCGLGADNSIMCLDTTSWGLSWWPSMGPAQLHMIHRYFAIVVTIAIIYYAIKNFKILKNLPNEFNDIKATQKLYSCLLIIVLHIQVILGVMTVAYNISPIPTTAHLAGAALALAISWKQYILYRSVEVELFPNGLHTLFTDIVDLTKPKLSALVMLTALVGLVLVPQHINFFKALWALVLIAMVVAGATSLNCYLEREVDKTMERTKDRPLPAGRLSAKFALMLGVVVLAISLPLLFFTVNPLTALLGFIAASSYLFMYTPMKRKSHLAVFVGALPGALPPVMGWTTVTGELGPMAWSLFAILFVWQIPHFMAISIVHQEDYKNAGIFVYPNTKGVLVTIQQVFIYTVFLMGASLLPFKYAQASKGFKLSAIVLGIAMLVLALQGFYQNRKEITELKFWGKKYFWGSIFYLPLLLASLIFIK